MSAGWEGGPSSTQHSSPITHHCEGRIMTAAIDVLEAAPPEVKRYQRQKTTARFVHLGLSLAGLFAATLLGPRLDVFLRGELGDGRWLRLVLIAAVWAVALELLTLP